MISLKGGNSTNPEGCYGNIGYNTSTIFHQFYSYLLNDDADDNFTVYSQYIPSRLDFQGNSFKFNFESDPIISHGDLRIKWECNGGNDDGLLQYLE